MSEARQAIEQSSVESVDDYQGEDLAAQNVILRRQNEGLHKVAALRCAEATVAKNTIAKQRVEIDTLQKEVTRLKSIDTHKKWQLEEDRRNQFGKSICTLSALW